MIDNEALHYLDNAATTRVAPEVADAIYKTMVNHWGNPSSLYTPGVESRELLDKARNIVGRTLGAEPVKNTCPGSAPRGRPTMVRALSSSSPGSTPGVEGLGGLPPWFTLGL